jgi:carboxylesterase
MPLMPGAEPFHADGGSTGVLLCHGLSGSPASMRPWGQYLAELGYTVDVPRLPGHGTSVEECNMTRWDDWAAEDERALLALAERCDNVFVGGLSMGGALALHLAQRHPDIVRGLMLVNPAIATDDPAAVLMPLLRLARIDHVVLGLLKPALANDIAKPDMDEIGYDRTPAKALSSFIAHWPTIVRDLHRVHHPMIVFHSPDDHVVDKATVKLLKADNHSSDFTYVALADSYHVATLDHDAPTIFERSAAFIERVRLDLDAPQKSAS